MAYIVFIAGDSRTSGKTLSVAMGFTSNVDDLRATLDHSSPFDLRVLGVEPGGEGRHRELQDRFATHLIKGVWYRPAEDLLGYAKALPSLEARPTKRVSLDLEPEDFLDLEVFLKEVGAKTKSSLLRRAYRFFRKVYRYKAEGYLIQAVKGGKMVQFDDLDNID